MNPLREKKTDENLTTNKNKSERRSVSRDSSTHLTQTRPEERERKRGENRKEKDSHAHSSYSVRGRRGGGRQQGLCTQGVGRAGGGQQSGGPEWTLDTRSLCRLPGDTHALLLAFVWSPDELSLILMLPAHHVHAAALSSLSFSFLLRYDSINMTSCIGGILSSFFPSSYSTSPRAYITCLFSLSLSSAVSSLICSSFSLLYLMSRKIHIRVVLDPGRLEQDLWLPSPFSFSVSLAASQYPNSSNSAAATPQTSQ